MLFGWLGVLLLLLMATLGAADCGDWLGLTAECCEVLTIYW